MVILNLLGGGGSGKTTIWYALMKLSMFTHYVSCTTRQPRQGEVDGVHYHFISEEKYFASEMILKRFACGAFYGTTEDSICCNDGKILVTTLDANGIRELESKKLEVVVLYLNILENERKRRMLQRGDGVEDVEKRLLSDRATLKDFNFKSPVFEVTSGSIEEILMLVHRFLSLEVL